MSIEHCVGSLVEFCFCCFVRRHRNDSRSFGYLCTFVYALEFWIWKLTKRTRNITKINKLMELFPDTLKR